MVFRAARRGGTFHLNCVDICCAACGLRAMTSHLMGTFARVDLAFERGEGVWLVATDGERYLDFTSGVAVNALGHAHPHLVAALAEQSEKLWHVSNLFEIPESERAAHGCARKLRGRRILLQFRRRGGRGRDQDRPQIPVGERPPERYRIVTFEGAFHGRTLATLAAGGQKKYLEGFGPPVEGFDQVPFGDFEAVKRAIGDETAAIMIEPLMGEGGVRSVEPWFLRALRELCEQHGLLLVFDEVQSGMGRTGELFAHQRTGVTPDVMSLAKALGGGFPVGAVLATEEAAKGMTAGTHGSTFGGNTLAMSAVNATLDIMLAPGFFEQVQRTALVFKQKLAELKDRYPALVAEVRGEGLLVGLRMLVPAGELVEATRAEHMLTVGAGDNVVRLLPPLIVSEQEIAEGVARLDRALARLAGAHKQSRKAETAG